MRGPAQRRRAGCRRLTLRGRITLALLAALPLGAIALLADRSGPLPAPAVLPVVSAEPSAPRLPDELFTQPPVARELLGPVGETAPGTRLVRRLDLPAADSALEVEYSLDVALSREVFRILDEAQVELGHVLVLDPASGALLVYAATDTERLPPTSTYPAASLIKVVTAAAALEELPDLPDSRCHSRGNPSRLTRRSIDPGTGGRSLSMQRALATSNNHCFAQLAVHTLGPQRMLRAIRRFGLLDPPAPHHAPGQVQEPGDDRLALGRLGCGLAGCRITPLHAARLAATLADGRSVTPWWVASVRDVDGPALELPARPEPTRVLDPSQAATLRRMLVDTTVRGTARRAFRTRRGPLLQGIQVAGKTGSLSGREPKGRYEWFIGVAPAEQPSVAVAVMVVYGRQWMSRPAQIAAEVLKVLFCPKGVCRRAAVERFLGTEEGQPSAVPAGLAPRSAG